LLQWQTPVDNLNVSAVLDTIPLTLDLQGAYRVGSTRVTLDLVVRAFNCGATAEQIVHKYDTLQLPDVYQMIGYYLKHAERRQQPKRIISRKDAKKRSGGYFGY
jgi:uncharacterized protein (DUF433 family)